jgi:Terminase large subunit, T4likevirus-type, N-terminal/Terminase RNaseH-like domain
MFTPSQSEFVYSKAPFPAFCGGFGSGKTAAGIARIMRLKRMCPNQDVAYYLPTYGLVEDIAYKRFPAMFERLGLNYKLNQQKARMQTDIGDIIFRTMDNPSRIVGYEVAHSLIDELDTLPTEKARDVWNKVIARNRQKAYTASGQAVANTVAVATTPEGFRFVYERWQKNKTEGYALYKAKTADNLANLPDDYIKNLQNTYSANLLSAYLDGEFVNLTSGSVYQEFDRLLNYCDSLVKEKEPLHIGMDFNVGKMAAVVYVLRETNPHAVNEFTDVFDTPAMAALIKRIYPKHAIYIYPDASGNARKSNNASESDLSLLRQAGFTILVNSRNPAVKDRILATNRMINNQGVRKLFVNTDTCPSLAESFEKQAYDKNGDPDKSSGLDHVIDAATYPIAYKFPIITHTQRLKLIGL